MKKLLALFTILFFLAGNSAWAQDEKKQESGSDANIDMNIEITMTIMMRMLEKANLSSDQSKKIEAILTKYTRDLVLLRRKEAAFLTKEQKETFNKAKKMAQRAKYGAKETEEYALKKLKLPQEKQDAFKKLKAEIIEKNDKMNAEIGALLSEEQKAKIPMFSGKKKAGKAKAGSALKAGSGLSGAGNAKKKDPEKAEKDN